MPPEQADQMEVLDQATDQKADSRGDLNRSGRASEGLEDRYAYYALAEGYGLNPSEILNPTQLEVGSQISVEGKQYVVMGNDGPDALLVNPDATLRTGQPIAVSEKDLTSTSTKIGDLGYYKDADGAYYLLRDSANGGKELVPDYNILPIKRRNLPVKRRA